MLNRHGERIAKPETPIDWESLGETILDQCQGNTRLVRMVARCLRDEGWLFGLNPRQGGDFPSYVPDNTPRLNITTQVSRECDYHANRE